MIYGWFLKWENFSVPYIISFTKEKKRKENHSSFNQVLASFKVYIIIDLYFYCSFISSFFKKVETLNLT